MVSEDSRWRCSRWVVLGAAATLLALVVAALFGRGEPTAANEGGANREAPRRPVTVLHAVPIDAKAEVEGFGEVIPRWSAVVRAQVDGVLTRVASGLQVGVRVANGELLAVVDPTACAAQLAEAENRLAMAKLALLREEQAAVEAASSWESSGLTGAPHSALVLHGPQLEAAQREMGAARAACDWAAHQLELTEIRAPFDGVVVQRHVSRGEAVLGGEPVAEIYASSEFELSVELSAAQWQLLPRQVNGAQARIVDPGGSGVWSATVVRCGGTIDPTSRMRSLILEIRDPLRAQPPLLPGSFVQMRLDGRSVSGLLQLPESVRTRSGHIWFVDDQGALGRFEAVPVFTRSGSILVRPPTTDGCWRIVRYPLDSFMVGQLVRAVDASGSATCTG